MDDTGNLPTKICEAVFRQVEEDRILNRENIQAVVRKELLAARREEPQSAAPQSLIDAAKEFRDAIAAEDMPVGFFWSPRVVGAYAALGNALMTATRKGASS